MNILNQDNNRIYAMAGASPLGQQGALPEVSLPRLKGG